ncbi:MAG TPA: GntR family transcriptional regulator [Streptosporangiaceae bacterium]|nr:GntR family transcriptional regulator [Streptosporangiaceae bacterium]
MTDPRYRQIADELGKMIESGRLVPRAQLPTEARLRERYDVSRHTIRDALRLLAARGLIDIQPGRGIFVRERFAPFVTTISADPEGGGPGAIEQDAYVRTAMEMGREASASKPRVEIQQAGRRVARALQLAEDAQVIARHQQRFLDGQVYSLQTSFYPLVLVQRGATELLLATNIAEGAVRYLHEHLGIELVGYQDRITARAPTAEEESVFGRAATGISIIEMDRTAYDRSGSPFRLTVTVFPADRNEIVVNVGELPPNIANPLWSAKEL